MDTYAKHTIISGDNIKKLAQYYMNNADEWVKIAILNNLDYPFIIDSERPAGDKRKVKYIGEKLLIPLYGTDSQDVDTSDDVKLYPFEVKEEYDRYLGTDLALFSNLKDVEMMEGEQAELSANNRGDLKVISGIDNLKQAILIKFATPLGSLLHHPDFGSEITKYIGRASTIDNIQKMKVECERTVLTDGRVREVEFPVFEYEFDKSWLRLEMVIRPISIEDVVNMSMTLNQGGVVTWG